MPLSISNTTGDGVSSPRLDTDIELPDSGQSVQIAGTVTPLGGPAVSINGSPLTAPAAPGSGFTYWVIQCDVTSGAASVKSSTVSMPLPDANAVIVFQQTLTPASTDEALSGDTTPDAA